MTEVEALKESLRVKQERLDELEEEVKGYQGEVEELRLALEKERQAHKDTAAMLDNHRANNNREALRSADKLSVYKEVLGEVLSKALSR